jgi:hypothetical protein
MKFAEIRIRQPTHHISDDTMGYQFDIYVKLPFERGLTWFIGRRPIIEHPSLSIESIIPIYNPAITSNLGKIICVSTNHGDIHLLKILKQKLVVNEKPIEQDYILRDGDYLKVPPLPLEIIYRIVEEKIERTEDDTLGFNYDETDAIA